MAKVANKKYIAVYLDDYQLVSLDDAKVDAQESLDWNGSSGNYGIFELKFKTKSSKVEFVPVK